MAVIVGYELTTVVDFTSSTVNMGRSVFPGRDFSEEMTGYLQGFSDGGDSVARGLSKGQSVN